MRCGVALLAVCSAAVGWRIDPDLSVLSLQLHSPTLSRDCQSLRCATHAFSLWASGSATL